LDEIAEIDRLLELHNGLWQTAAILQVNADESRILIPDFQQSYHAWYYRALRVLPDDLRPGFKQQYEGLPENGAWGTTVVVGIRQFLEDPLKTYKDVGQTNKICLELPMRLLLSSEVPESSNDPETSTRVPPLGCSDFRANSIRSI